ncbi:MAG TPA: UbiA family prenyltransferase [Thermoanaerobaculia bacterium]
MKNVLRAGEWWEFKLAPLFAAFYGTAFLCGAPISSLWRGALIVLLAIAPGAAFVSVLNDLTDRDEDRAAGKHNRLAGTSPILAALLLAATIACGLIFAFLWRRDTALLSCYLAAWTAFSLYSLRPFRFKSRGLLGVLCDASGAHLFPTLVAVLIAYRSAAHAVHPMWIAAVAVWAFACGLRGIVAHQLRDVENDRRSGVRTFAQRSPRLATFAGTWIVFPIELAALALMLVQLNNAWPLALLGVYLVYASALIVINRRQPEIVAPVARPLTLLQDYYTFYFPAAIVIASAMQHPRDWFVLAIHVIVFPASALRPVGDVLRALRRSARS